MHCRAEKSSRRAPNGGREPLIEARRRPTVAASSERRNYREFLLTPRWLSLLLIALLSIPACVELGRWQWHRLEQARANNHLITDNSRGTPLPVDQLSSVGGTVTGTQRWRAVEVTGTYDGGHTLLVRNRSRDNGPGFQVLTPVVTAGGTAAVVDRGWLPAPEPGGLPDIPAVPTGAVTVTGLLRPTETQPSRGPHDGPDVPVGQVVRIDIPRISKNLPYPVYAGYVDLRAQDPAPPIVEGQFTPDPDSLPGGETEMLHLAYASQWFVFAGVAPLGFLMLARREAADRRDARGRPAPKGGTPLPTT
jgi:cytochrome oxidase assembly protein ShyY1